MLYGTADNRQADGSLATDDQVWQRVLNEYSSTNLQSCWIEFGRWLMGLKWKNTDEVSSKITILLPSKLISRDATLPDYLEARHYKDSIIGIEELKSCWRSIRKYSDDLILLGTSSGINDDPVKQVYSNFGRTIQKSKKLWVMAYLKMKIVDGNMASMSYHIDGAASSGSVVELVALANQKEKKRKIDDDNDCEMLSSPYVDSTRSATSKKSFDQMKIDMASRSSHEFSSKKSRRSSSDSQFIAEKRLELEAERIDIARGTMNIQQKVLEELSSVKNLLADILAARLSK